MTATELAQQIATSQLLGITPEAFDGGLQSLELNLLVTPPPYPVGHTVVKALNRFHREVIVNGRSLGVVELEADE